MDGGDIRRVQGLQEAGQGLLSGLVQGRARAGPDVQPGARVSKGAAGNVPMLSYLARHSVHPLAADEELRVGRRADKSIHRFGWYTNPLHTVCQQQKNGPAGSSCLSRGERAAAGGKIRVGLAGCNQCRSTLTAHTTPPTCQDQPQTHRVLPSPTSDTPTSSKPPIDRPTLLAGALCSLTCLGRLASSGWTEALAPLIGAVDTAWAEATPTILASRVRHSRRRG